MKKHLKIIITFIAILLAPYSVLASSIFQSIDINELDLSSINKTKIDDIKNTIENLSVNENIINSNVSAENLDPSTIDEIIKVYEELSEVVSNEEIADFIDDNKNVLSNAGANKSLLSASSTLLRNFDPNTVIEVVKNDINIDEILESSESTSSSDILSSVIENTSTTTKINVILKLLFSNGYFKLVFALFVVVSIYSIFITGIIFKKAGKPSFRNNYTIL